MKYQDRINNLTLPLNSKRPILLRSHHPFVDLLIGQYHGRSKHGGVNDTLMMLRENYWILKGRLSMKWVIKNCVVCLKCEGLPYNVTTISDFPTERVSDLLTLELTLRALCALKVIREILKFMHVCSHAQPLGLCTLRWSIFYQQILSYCPSVDL